METNSHKPEGFKLDAVTMERHAEMLPQEMQADFLWLGAFFRDVCGRSLAVLEERCTKLGIKTERTNWSKILRGKWNRDSNNNLTAAPVLSVQRFLKEVGLLRKDEQLRAMAGKVPFVMTPSAQRMFNYFDLKRAPDRVNRFGVTIGPTGSQKTATAKEYCRLNNHGTCVWLEAPENGSMKEFLTRLAEKYGIGNTQAYDYIRARIFESVSESKTIIVDNVQRLYKPKNGGDQPVFSFLQRLQDERGCTVILMITPTFEKTLTAGMAQGFFEQFEGRAGGRETFLRLPEYAPDEDVLAIAKGFGLRQAESHVEELAKIAHQPGRIRRLFEVLQDAKIASEAGKEQLTIAHVREALGEEA